MLRTIEISVPDQLLQLLDEKALRSGLGRDEYVSALLSKPLAGPPTLAQVLKPFRDQVTASGATDADLGRLFAQARQESHRARRA